MVPDQHQQHKTILHGFPIVAFYQELNWFSYSALYWGFHYINTKRNPTRMDRCSVDDLHRSVNGQNDVYITLLNKHESLSIVLLIALIAHRNIDTVTERQFVEKLMLIGS